MRALATLLLAAALAGCATPADDDGERIVEVASGRQISRAELLNALRASDYVLLGEQHDNALHHQRRAELLRALGAGVPVVAEHLTRGQTVRSGAALLPRLQAAGFDEKGWRWPLHEPLFAAALAPGHLLLGGNLPREQVREIARRGEAALPADLRTLLAGAVLNETAGKALDAALVEGHCGMLAGERLAAMRWAQRARDAAMWLSLKQPAQAPGRPAVLLAGNGHVRLDYGVGQLAAADQPRAKLLSLAFVEQHSAPSQAAYTHVWVTAAPVRQDPCVGLRETLGRKSATAP